MLTREGFVAANMSGQSTLQRSSWKAEAIRKGNLKISGPIPIMENTPLNDEEEKEYAETGALQSPSQPPDELEPLDSRPQTPPQPDHPPPSIPMERASLMSHPVDEQTQEVIHERQASRSPPRQQYVTETARESVVDPISYSQNGHRSTPESASKAAQKKKRKSGLRNVFRKMFGRRSRDEPEQEEVSRRGHSYHHSDPGMLQPSSPREAQQTPHGTRISDLPVKELQPLHPLGQHLPFPMNVNAPQASPPKEYLTFDHERPDIGRRRATLPSVPSTGIQRHSLDEPRGRLSAWDERPDDETLPSPGIGIALSSPTQSTSVQAKRRSRSADALRDMAKERASIDRRRSAEIRYWRQSHASGSVYSRPQTAKTVESIRSVQERAPAITEPEDGIQAMSATMGHVDEPTPSPSNYDEKQDVEPPVSAFNFGLQNETREEETRSPEDFIPSSPPERATNRLSIEDRVANLEGTFQSIESSLRRMSSRTNRQTIILSEAPRNLRSRNTSSSNSNSNANFDKLPDYQSSNDTLKSNPASPTLVKPSAEGSKEQVIEKLYEALKYERAARKALEQQVQGLQHDIADLHALVNKLIASATATSPSYPTPSPDTLILSTEERIATPRVERKEQYGHGKENLVRTGSNDDRYARNEAEWREEMPTPNDGDVWATPKEEVFSGSGFFHEERRYA